MSFKFFIRHRHQHIKPSAKEIAKAHILKADIFILEKPDISIWGLHGSCQVNISSSSASDSVKDRCKFFGFLAHLVNFWLKCSIKQGSQALASAIELMLSRRISLIKRS